MFKKKRITAFTSDNWEDVVYSRMSCTFIKSLIFLSKYVSRIQGKNANFENAYHSTANFRTAQGRLLATLSLQNYLRGKKRLSVWVMKVHLRTNNLKN